MTLAVSNPDVYLARAGAVGQTVPRQLRSASAIAPVSGTLIANSVVLPQGFIPSSMTMVTGGTAKLTGTHGWYVIFDLNRQVIAVTADQVDPATVWGATGTEYNLTFAQAQACWYTGQYYAGVMVAAGTMPTFVGSPGLAAGSNGGPPAICGTAGAGLTIPPNVNSLTAAFSAAAGFTLAADVF